MRRKPWQPPCETVQSPVPLVVSPNLARDWIADTATLSLPAGAGLNAVALGPKQPRKSHGVRVPTGSRRHPGGVVRERPLGRVKPVLVSDHLGQPSTVADSVPGTLSL